MSSFVPPNVTDTAYGYMLGKNWGHGSAGSAGSMDNESKALHQWKGYAKSLEMALREQKEQTWGQAGIKAAALKEIARIDPNNPLLKQEKRSEIYDQAVDEAKKSGKID